MKNGIWIAGAAAGAALLMAGCATEKITVDYVMPAKAVTDVKKVDVVKIEASAKVSGAMAGDAKANAGLLKQLLSMRLCKEGFYKVVDGISGDPEGAFEIQEMIKKSDAGHGYSALGASEQGSEKAVIKLSLDMSLDAKQAKKEIPFTLTTVNYKPVKKGDIPASEPDPKATVVENVKKTATVWETVAKGRLSVVMTDRDGKEVYKNAFDVAVPETCRYAAAKPSQLAAFAAAVSPAVDGVVADISPYRESRELVAVEGGDERVKTLLNAKAFMEVETLVDEMMLTRKANFADFANRAIALEATGDFSGARDYYKMSAEANPGSAEAKAGLKRAEDAISGRKAVKASGAKRNKDTQFSK